MRHTVARAESPAPASRFFAFFFAFKPVERRARRVLCVPDPRRGPWLTHWATMLTPDTLDVVMVSLEGPDQYSQAGGLGVRARELCRATAALGYRTTLVFAGDPAKPAEET